MPSNFSGNWKCCAVGDNFSDFLKIYGAGRIIRTLAYMTSYGVNREVENITMASENDIQIINHGPRRKITQTLKINGTEQSAENIPDGSPMSVTPSWDGDTFVMDQRGTSNGSGSGKALCTVVLRRTLEDNGQRLRTEMIATTLDGKRSLTPFRLYERTDSTGQDGWGAAARQQLAEEQGELMEDTPRAQSAGYS